MPYPRKATQAEREKRRTRIAEMLAERLSYSEMAKRLGVGKSTITRDVRAMLDEWRESRVEDVETQVVVELHTLAKLQQGIAYEANGGDLPSIDRVLKIMERRAKLLGLDSPTKIAPTDPTGVTPYHESVDAELVALLYKVTGE